MKMRRTLQASAFLAVGALGYFGPDAAGAVVSHYSTPPVAVMRPATDAATVKVIMAGGHGSGVHIGGGFVLTAAHVAGDETSVQLKTKDGQTRSAEVLWVNKAYDIALLRTSPETLGSAHLNCRVASAGESIQSIGNPLAVEFVSAFGKIAGEPRKLDKWASVYVTDITTVMGQSGGPVFSSDGDLVGITVNLLAVPIGFSASLSGFGFVVPSHDVCALLGRVA